MATTLAWSAPELLTGGAKTTFSDMYAFGVFMWELMTCLVPFDGVSPDLIGLQVKSGIRPAIPSPLPEGFPDAFVDITMGCLQHDPHQRPSAQQVHQRLLLIDSTARPSVPLHLFDARTAAPASRPTLGGCAHDHTTTRNIMILAKATTTRMRRIGASAPRSAATTRAPAAAAASSSSATGS
jgi:serine/threonine protein kinase